MGLCLVDNLNFGVQVFCLNSWHGSDFNFRGCHTALVVTYSPNDKPLGPPFLQWF